MMKVIFECETEVGKCDGGFEPDDINDESNRTAVFAHTQASVAGTRGMLKVEQHCYLRRGGEIPDQPWVRPEITFEPALESKQKMLELARNMHAQFVERVRKEFLHKFAA